MFGGMMVRWFRFMCIDFMKFMEGKECDFLLSLRFLGFVKLEWFVEIRWCREEESCMGFGFLIFFV